MGCNRGKMKPKMKPIYGYILTIFCLVINMKHKISIKSTRLSCIASLEITQRKNRNNSKLLKTEHMSFAIKLDLSLQKF